MAIILYSLYLLATPPAPVPDSIPAPRITWQA